MKWLVLIFFSFIGFSGKQKKKKMNSVYLLSNTGLTIVHSMILFAETFFFHSNRVVFLFSIFFFEKECVKSYMYVTLSFLGIFLVRFYSYSYNYNNRNLNFSLIIYLLVYFLDVLGTTLDLKY